MQPLAIKVMREFAIDISKQESKTLDRYLDDRFDYVVTVCDDANESCPVFRNAEHRLPWSLPDLSKATAERTAAYRAVRDRLLKLMEQELLA